MSNNFKIIGISIETTNENGQAITDLGALWGKFYTENVIEKIPNKTGNEVYSVYTDYESDHTGKYTTIIGSPVSSLDLIPDGLVGRTFEGANFKKFTAKGSMPNAIAETWKEIWQKDKELNRSYTYDFEVYGEKSQNSENSEVEIFIAVK
ncbi:MAG: AraC family transcriptional regulator [Flavobacteriia bacterium]|nr:AraC family transcriptional regulator [Flavobacteriia bacterium]OJX39077.1 MAG: AraC family transcriptional regulator [Flavobacteriia bacterium 40-80]